MLGEIVLDFDAAGCTREARAGDQAQTWEYANGFPSVHTGTDASGVTVTRIVRDDTGRIVRLDGQDGTTEYDYDNAGQLIAATSVAGARKLDL